jgi:hypothetical protein
VTRRSIVIGAALLLVGGGAAAGIAVAFGGGDSPLTLEQYLARADAVCISYSRKLDRVVPPDPTSTADVAASVGKALPILRAQADAVRRIRPPHELESRVRAFFVRTDRSLAALASELEAAKRNDAKTMNARFGDWVVASAAAQEASKRVGYHC